VRGLMKRDRKEYGDGPDGYGVYNFIHGNSIEIGSLFRNMAETAPSA